MQGYTLLRRPAKRAFLSVLRSAFRRSRGSAVPPLANSEIKAARRA